LDRDKASDIEQKIAELKRRWPVHSVPPAMWSELEELEEELRLTKEAGDEGRDGRETGFGRL
jgi:hypothetical protein